MDSLDSTFGLFFGDEPSEACCDCGGTAGLQVLYTTEAGDATWICRSCKVRRDAAQTASAKSETDRIAEIAWRDAWEE
jgi:hypothetical protein